MAGVIPKGPDLCYVRADTLPLTMNFTRSGVGEDWTGWTNFQLTVNIDEDPADASGQQLQMDGTPITPPDPNGAIDWEPEGIDEAAKRVTSEAYVPGDYFYDVQADDPTGRRATILKGGNFTVVQDINKG